MKQYHTDQELIELLDEIDPLSKIAELIRERFEQKDRQMAFLRERLDTAANLIGHNTISEMMYE